MIDKEDIVEKNERLKRLRNEYSKKQQEVIDILKLIKGEEEQLEKLQEKYWHDTGVSAEERVDRYLKDMGFSYKVEDVVELYRESEMEGKYVSYTAKQVINEMLEECKEIHEKENEEDK